MSSTPFMDTITVRLLTRSATTPAGREKRMSGRMNTTIANVVIA